MTAGDDGKKDAGQGKRRAVKPPTIDLKASRVEDAPGTEGSGAGRPEAGAKPAGAETAPGDAKADEAADAPKAETRAPGAASSSPASSSVPPSGAKPAGAGTARPDSAGNKAAPAGRGAGFWILAAILGGLVGGGAVYGAYYAGFLPGRAPDMSAITILQGRVDRLENRPAAQPADLKPLEERVAKLESAPPPAADTGALETRIAALEERMSGLSAGGGATVDLTPVEGRLAALEDRLATLAQGGGKGGDSGGDIAALREDLASMQREVQGALQTLRQRAETPAPGAGQQQGAQKSGQIQAALSLREAVARGAVPQGTIRDAGALGLATAPLEEALQAGPVSLDMLTAAFNDNAGAMIQAARPPASGLMGRIAEGARSLISIRAAGPQAGDTPEAVISRIDAALQRGDSGLASAEFQKLPAESQAASGNFGELLKRREAQLGAADALVRQAIGG